MTRAQLAAIIGALPILSLPLWLSDARAEEATTISEAPADEAALVNEEAPADAAASGDEEAPADAAISPARGERESSAAGPDGDGGEPAACDAGTAAPPPDAFWRPPSNAARPAHSTSDVGGAADDPPPAPEAPAAREADGGEEPDGDDRGQARNVLRFGSIELAPDLKLYADYQVDLGSDDVENAFHITRAYLGLRARITPWLSGRVTYDVSQATDVGRAGTVEVTDGEGVVDGSRVQGSMLARLKYAYVSFSIERLSLDLRLGVIHTPWIDWMEHIEGSRFLRKIMLENEYHYPSADFGLGVTGHIRNVLAYFVGVYNGEGYHGIEDSRFKDFIGRISLRPFPSVRPLAALQLSGYAQVEFPGSIDGVDQDTHRRFGGALTYRYADEVLSPDAARVRGEVFALWFQAFYGQDGPADAVTSTWGFSVGGRVELPANFFLLGRLDRFDADLSDDSADSLLWTVLAVVGYRPARGVIVALDYQGRYGPGDDRHVLGIHAELHL